MKQGDQRARLTKMLIRKAFTELLKQKPIQKISVKELCEKAGINRGTFYAHYLDVYDLLEKLEDEMTEEFVSALQPLIKNDPTPLAVTTGIFRCIKDNSDICTVTLGNNGDKEFAAKLINIGRECCMESYVRRFEKATPRQIEYFYAFVSAGCLGMLEKWMSEGMADDAEDISAMAESIMMQGIGFLTNGKSGPKDKK